LPIGCRNAIPHGKHYRITVNRSYWKLLEIVPDAMTSFEAFEDNETIAKVLNQFLGSLPPKQRNIFVKRYWHLQSIEKIADEYKLSTNNIKQILFRARKKLKNNLKKEGIII